MGYEDFPLADEIIKTYGVKKEFNKNDVVQFNETHPWCGCLGIVDEVKDCGDDIRYMVGVPVPKQGTAFIMSMGSKNEFDYIGKAVMVAIVKEE